MTQTIKIQAQKTSKIRGWRSQDCLVLLKNILGKDLIGFYLYGSLLLGGLQKFSDLDLFAVSNRPTTLEEKEQLEKALLKISGIYAVSKDQKPIELIIVVQSDINPWQYPPRFDFLYGDWLRVKFESGNIEPWPTKVLPNLALVITQLLLSNKVLLGSNSNQLLTPVPYKDFLNATTSEIESLMKDLDWDRRNVLLTLARIWCTLETDAIQSKSNAAIWTIERLPEKYKQILERANSILLGQIDENWEGIKDEVKPCSVFMVEQIKMQMEIIKSSNYSERRVKIG